MKKLLALLLLMLIVSPALASNKRHLGSSKTAKASKRSHNRHHSPRANRVAKKGSRLRLSNPKTSSSKYNRNRRHRPPHHYVTHPYATTIRYNIVSVRTSPKAPKKNPKRAKQIQRGSTHKTIIVQPNNSRNTPRNEDLDKIFSDFRKKLISDVYKLKERKQ